MTAFVRLTGQAAACGALAVALLAAAEGLAQPTPPEMTVAQSVELGRALTQRNCGMCHAVGPTGVSANPQAPPFRYLNQRMDVEKLGEGLTTGILTGHPEMPAFRFEPYEVVSIVRYLRSVQAHTRAQARAAPSAD